jgi:hypothetical protein
MRSPVFGSARSVSNGAAARNEVIIDKTAASPVPL